MTDERRVEVAAEALRADGWTCEYHEPTARRGECSGCDATLDASARAVVAALDAHDGDLRERLAGAVEARRDPDPGYADLYGNGYNDGLTDAARIIRERP